MEKRKIIPMIISTFGVFLILIGVTYSFFNYTRTGSNNVIKVGRISFNTNQQSTISLLNAFPIDKTNARSDSDNTDDVSIEIIGDTTYSDGIEYLLTITSLTNMVGNKKVPIDILVSPANIGDSDEDYFDNRGGTDSIYKVLNDGTISNNQQILVGYIPKGSTGINGGVTIRAYLDKDKIAISDTYPSTNTGYRYNVDATSTEINNCVTYLENEGYDDIPSENETLEAFCMGTGTLYGEKIDLWISDDWFYDGEIEGLVTTGIILTGDNGTTDNWVNGRKVLTTTEWNSLQTNGVSFQVKVEANEGIWVTESGDLQLKKAILNKESDTNVQCSNITYEEDGITYLSGSNECVDMNYVWYSGKLWRITAIYPNGSMKLITEDMITSINWGNSVEYDGSWVYQWLNEDFYDTLVNPNNIIDSNSVWNYSNNNSTEPLKPETISVQKRKKATVGLMNVYEYYNSYRNIENNGYGYLINGYTWWLITPYYSNYVFEVYINSLHTDEPNSRASGVRPSIVIKSGIGFTGNGTKTSPYKIVGDKADAVNNTTLLSSRSVGEYVKFDNDLYRIVDTSNGITKLNRVEYLSDSGTKIAKIFASSPYYGKEENTATDDYWDYYLNNTWYNNISSIYKNMLVDGTYYLGFYPNNINYKSTICKDNNLDSVTTKNCTRYIESDADKTFIGKVGLPRVGEMFSSQIGVKTSPSTYIYTITPSSSFDVRSVSVNGYLYTLLYGSSYSVRPSITLKSGIKITGGTGYVGGDTNSPFEISE